MERKPNRSMWDPLSEPLFRALWIAALASNIGSWMHDVAAAWLMTSLSSSPVMISLMQTASYLPFFLLALPAGAFADIFNRRTVLLVGQTWMLVAAAGIGLCSLCGWMNPWLLLTLTLMLGVGGAITSPAWNAVLPELVSKKNLEGAIALGGMGWNIARGVGSAIGGVIVAMSGPSAVFLINALSFLAVLWVFWSWKRPPSAESTNNERVVGAIRAGVRFVRHSPVLLAVLWRTLAFVSCSTCFWAILPLFCRVHLKLEANQYGFVLTLFGVGAIVGAGLLPKMRKTMSLDACTAVGTLMFASGMLGLAFSPSFGFALISSTIAGAAWIAVTSSLNMGAQLACPAWVRSRALAVYILVWHGTMAVASLAWGTFANFFNMENALLVAACGLMISLLLAPRRHKLGDLEHVDLSASGHWPDPVLAVTPHPEHGPVQVSIEYLIQPEKAKEFAQAMSQLAVQRRRDGAFQWHLMCDLEDPRKYVETYFVETWAEHERQHQRVTIADKAAEEKVDSFHLGPNRPYVRHLISGIGFDGEIIAPERTEMLPGTEPGQPPCGVCGESSDVSISADANGDANANGDGDAADNRAVPASSSPATQPISVDTSDQEVYADTGEQVAFSPDEDLNTPSIPLPVVKPAGSGAGTIGNTTLMSATREGDSLADFLSDLSTHQVPSNTVPAAEAQKSKNGVAGDGDSLADFLSDLGSQGSPAVPVDERIDKIDSSVDIEALFAQDPGDTLTKIRPLRSPEWVDTFDGIERPNLRDGNIVDIDSLFSKQDRLHVVDDDADTPSDSESPLVDGPAAQSLFDLFDSFEASAGGRKDAEIPRPAANAPDAAAAEEQVDTFQDIQALKDQPQQDKLTPATAEADNHDSGDTGKTPNAVPDKNVPSDTLVDMDVYFGQDPGDTLVDIEALSLRNPEDRLLLETDKIDTLVDIEALEAYCSQNPADKLTRPPSDNSSLFRTPMFSGIDDDGDIDDPRDTITGMESYSSRESLDASRPQHDSSMSMSVETGDDYPSINTGEMEALHIDTDDELSPIIGSITGEMSAVEIDEPVLSQEEPAVAALESASAVEEPVSTAPEPVSTPLISTPKDAISALKEAVSGPPSKDPAKDALAALRDAVSASKDRLKTADHQLPPKDQIPPKDVKEVPADPGPAKTNTPGNVLSKPIPRPSLADAKSILNSAKKTEPPSESNDIDPEAGKDVGKSLPSKRQASDATSGGRKLLPLDPRSDASTAPEPKSATPEPKSVTPEPKSDAKPRSYDPKSGLPSRTKEAKPVESKPESKPLAKPAPVENKRTTADTKIPLTGKPADDDDADSAPKNGGQGGGQGSNGHNDTGEDLTAITGETAAFDALSDDELLQGGLLTDATSGSEES